MWGIGKFTQPNTAATQWNPLPNAPTPGKQTQIEGTQSAAATAPPTTTTATRSSTEPTPSGTATTSPTADGDAQPPPTRKEVELRMLDVQWHGNVYAALVGDVADAQANFQVACTEFATDLKLEHEEIPFLIEVAFDAISVIAVGAATRALERFRKGAEEITKVDELALTVDLPAPQFTEHMKKLAEAVVAVPPKSIDFMIEQAVTKGKKTAQAAVGTGEANLKSAGLVWIEQIQKTAPLAFRAYRDAAMPLPLAPLLIAREAFNREDHTPPAYKEQIEERYRTFKANPVADIGSHATHDLKTVRVHRKDGTARLGLVEHDDAVIRANKWDRITSTQKEKYVWRGWVEDAYASTAIALTEAKFGEVEDLDWYMMRFVKGAPQDE